MRTILIPLLAIGALTACSADAPIEANTMATAQAGIVQNFTVTTDASTYNPGDSAVFTVTGAPANAFLAFFWTDNGEGVGPCPPILEGACIDINSPAVDGGFYYFPRANAAGVATNTAVVPGDIAFGDYTFQAVAYDPATGNISGAAPITITNEAPATGCSPDAYEPNNGTADIIPDLPASPVVGLESCDTEPTDYFAIDLLVGEEFTLDATFATADGDLDLFIVDTVIDIAAWGDINGVALASSITTSDNESLTFSPAADGTYYVVVYNWEGDTAIGSTNYDLDWSVGVFTPTDCAVDDAEEDNDEVLTAGPIGAGLLSGLYVCNDDFGDFYTFAGVTGETINATADWDEVADVDDDLDLYLLDSLGYIIVAEEFGIGEEVLSYDITVDETLYLAAIGYNTGADDSIEYSLDVSFTLAPTDCVSQEASEATGNNDIAAGASVAFPTSGYVCTPDPSDFYVIDVLTGDTLDLSLLIGNVADDDLDLYLYDSTGNEITRSWETGIDEAITHIATADETLTIEARAYDVTIDGSYTLDAVITPAP